jgi:hypothetical protein
MDKTQLGRAGELALALYALVSSGGELQLYTPVADDDHVDATAGRRGGIPAIAIQVKTAGDLDDDGLVEAKADYPKGQVREHPAFLYAVLWLESVAIRAAWIVPSPDLNRLAYRTASAEREIIEFRGHPDQADKFSAFRVAPTELGPRLLAIIDSLAERIPAHLLERGSGLMLASRQRSHTIK